MSHRPSALFLPLLLAACAAEGDPPLPTAPSPPPEESVQPGINDRFLSPDLDVDRFVENFEGEAREISTARHGILAALELETGMAVGDIGAGTGLFTVPMAEAVGPRGVVYAVEIAPAFVAHLEERAAQAGLGQVRAVLCDERSTGLAPASIDLAFVCDTYHHFEYPRSTLASIRTALRPGGRLVIVDFERIAGVSRPWTLDHVRAGKEEVVGEIEAAGFALEDEVDVDGLVENYLLRFRRR